MHNVTMSDIITFLHLARKLLGPQALRQLVARLDDPASDGVALPEVKTAQVLIADAGRLPPMLVDRLLPANSLFLLTGKPKAGKSFLALDIANSVCHAAPVFGTLLVNTAGPVLYLAMEDGPMELARRLAQRGFQPGEHPLYFIDEAFSLTDPIRFHSLRERVRTLAPALIIIDTAAEALDIRDWINRAEILAKIAPIRAIAREFCTVLLIAHNRKAQGDMGDEIAGSNALAGAVDGWISAHKVERRANGNRRLFLRIEGRGGVGHELVVEMDHATLNFSTIPDAQVETDAASERQGTRTVRQQQRRDLAHKTLGAMATRATIAELASAMGVSYSVAWPIVRDMVASGEIEEIRTPDAATSGRRAPTYRLRPLPPSAKADM